jgi:heterogeneous nuclear ribonucleoprotein F/H
MAQSGLAAARMPMAQPNAQTLSPGPTVKIRGLPFRSSPADILSFFSGYHYLPDSLQIGLDQLGRPSGEAWLNFVSPQEAMRSVRDLNRHYLGNRYLELSVCQQ